MARNASVPRARLVRLALCLSLLVQPLLPGLTSASAARNAVDTAVSVSNPVAARQGAEAADLPDLNEARNRPHHEPKAIPPVSSTRRRCPPHNRRCNDDIDHPGRPAPTPAPTGRSAQAGSLVGFIARNVVPSLRTIMMAALDGGRPSIDVPQFDFYSGEEYSATDSEPVSPLSVPATSLSEPASPLSVPADYAAAAAPAPLIQAQPTPQTLVTNVASLGSLRADGPGWTGLQITTGSQPLTLTSIGRMCLGGNSLLHELRVIRASDNVLVAATSVSMSGCTVGQFRYEDLTTPVTLSASTAYIVVSYEAGGDLFYDWTGTWLTTTADASINGAVYTINGGQTWSLATGSGNSYVPVDLKYTPGLPSTNFVTSRTSGAMRADSPGWAGFQMTTASQPVAVTSLGRLCLPNNALSHDLKIVRASDNVTVASATVSMSGCTSGQFKYAQLANPATLAANTSYVFVSYEAGGDLFYDWTGQWLTTTSVATINGAVYTINGGQTWSLATGSGNSYVPVDFKYQTSEQALGAGLTAKYYDNLDFTSYKFTRTDPVVNFDWSTGAPSPSMGVDQFSVRWQGMVVPRYSQTYTFYATTDDGVRLWVDRQLVIDKWIDQGPTTWSAQLPLDAGRQYDIRMEFYENSGGASAKLEWQSASQAREVIPQNRLYPCWKGIADFIKEFYQQALARQPSAAELQDWTARLAQAQGETQLKEEARALGITLFDLSASSAYSARNRSNGDFAADLYRAFLQRDPDQTGWNYWIGQVQANGRATVREAFAQSDEFREKVIRLCDASAAADVNSGTGYNFATARLDPNNRAGSDGVDPYSRNFNFQIPLVSLPGRAGLDLGLMLSYNSLVWTKDATGITFDADNGFPGPGFRLGFPVIQPRFVNPQLQQTGQATKSSYLLVTSSGAHVELRETATAGIYESADSSYLQLTEAVGSPQTLTTPDGTQMSYALINGEYRCYQIKDRNGNYVSVAYNGNGSIDKVTDTLGRVVTFNYDSFQNLISITQPWKRETEANPSGVDETHKWATFGYTNVTLQPSFSGLAVMGDQPGTVIPALSQVGLDDGSYYKFEYNQWGQVWKLTHYAADAVDVQHNPTYMHALSSTWINLPGAGVSAGGAVAVPATAQADCPRFTQEKKWVENGVMNHSGEVTTSYSTWAQNMASCDVTVPDGTVLRDLYATSGWQRGLTTESQIWSGGQEKKWTTLSWTQDNTGVSYSVNPRVTDTTINDDSNNHRRTSVTFQTFTPPVGGSVALPRDVVEYKADASTVLRTTRTEYNLSTDYTSRRIIGLPSFRYVYEGVVSGGNLRSKVGYVYDELNDSQDTFLAATPTAASQHDGQNYGTGMRWRGNINREQHYSVDQQTGAVGAYVESRSAFNITGTVAYKRDAADHKTSSDYVDSFFQNVNRTNTDPQQQLKTYAYPTTLTDADGFTAKAVYNYDMGVVSQTKSPKPNVQTNQPDGPVRQSYYDGAARLVKVISIDNGGYTSWTYPDKMDMVETRTLIETGKESYSAQVLDGAGRVRATANNLPYSSGYAGQFFDYDSMGRLARQSNPTATTASGLWPATDEDAANDWLYTETTYDWKGRPLVVTNPAADSNSAATTKEFLYGGCGCAGGEVVLTRDEVGRRQRFSYDVLGRGWKTETLSQQTSKPQPFADTPSETPYLTTTNTYDALGNVTQVSMQAGATGVTQVTTMSYDGYGRLSGRKEPAATAATSYDYYGDDTLHTVTDARGAVTTYQYNGRHQRLAITYTVPSGVEPTSDVHMQYDAAGNRLNMTDGLGRVDYEYNNLSQLTAERRYISSLGRTYSMTSDYNKASQLAYVVDAFNARFDYQRDAAGRLTDVTPATPYGGTTSYVSNVRYRAWGGIKSASYGDHRSSTIEYKANLRPWKYRLTDDATGTGVMREDFSFSGDGRLASLTDLNDTAGNNPPSTLRFLSRQYSYDLLGRVAGSYGSGGGGTALPLTQNYDYDEFGNLTYRSGSYFYSGGQTDTAHFTNNRRDGWSYDADGRYASNPASSTNTARSSYYDAAGRQVKTVESRPASGGLPASTFTYMAAYDGDGQLAYETSIDTAPAGVTKTSYTLHSRALGGEKLTTLTSSGSKDTTYVPAEGMIFALQSEANVASPIVTFTERDPVGVTESSKGIYDPLGNFIPFQQQADPRPPAGSYNSGSMGGLSAGLSNPNSYGNACYLDGVPSDCTRAFLMLNHGAAEPMGGRGTSLGGRFIIDHDRGEFRESYYYFGDLAPGGQRNNTINPQRNIPLPDLNKLTDALLKTSDCGSYIEQLLNQVATDTKNPAFSDYFTDLFAQVHIDFSETKRLGGEHVAGGISGSFVNHNATIHISPQQELPGMTDFGERLFIFEYVITAVHETIHLAGTNAPYTDRQLAEAAVNLGGLPEGALDAFKKIDPKDRKANSEFWDAILQNHCTGPNGKPGFK